PPLTRTYGQNRLEEAVARALETGLGNAAGIRHILESAERREETVPPLEDGRWKVLPAADISAYDALGSGQ
ncbi:MAG: hypothetical protein WC948_03140, partial [Thermovirgaceae bacterium]